MVFRSVESFLLVILFLFLFLFSVLDISFQAESMLPAPHIYMSIHVTSNYRDLLALTYQLVFLNFILDIARGIGGHTITGLH